MKKFLSLVLVLLSVCEAGLAIPIDTTGWACHPEHVSVSASEIDLKSDLKNDYRVFQVTLTNLTNHSLEVIMPMNAIADEAVNKILNNKLSIKDLMDLPKEIAVGSYNEKVADNTFGKAHKGLLYILGSAGAACAGATLIGVYPQQKTEEYFSHKKIKKEYKKISGELVGEVTIEPMGEEEVFLMVPIENEACIIKTKLHDDESDVYTDYHQL